MEQSDETMVHTDDCSVFKYVSPLVFLFKLSGIYAESSSPRRLLTSSHWVYCVVIWLLYTGDAVRYLTVFSKQEIPTKKYMGMCVMAMFSVMVPLFSILHLFALSKHLKPFCSELIKYEEKYGTAKSFKTFTKHKKAVICGTIVTSLAVAAMMCCFFVYLPENALFITNLHPFVESSNQSRHIIIVCQVIKTFFTTVMLFVTLLFYVKVSYHIIYEYKRVTSSVQQLLNTDSEIFLKDHVSIENIRKHQEAVTYLLACANPILQQTVLVCYLCGIPVLCFIVYGLVHSNISLTDFFTLLDALITTNGFLLVVICLGAFINAKAHEPRDLLFRIDLTNLSGRTIRQMNIFINRVSGPAMGVDLHGLFVLDNSSLLMLFGTVLTYTIVILQFPTSSNDCACPTITKDGFHLNSTIT